MRILLLQDNAEAREKFIFYLESTFGAEVQGTSSVSDGLQICRAAKPPFDLILWDCKKGNDSDMNALKVEASKILTIASTQSAPSGLAVAGTIVGVIERSGFAEGVSQLIQDLVKKGSLQIVLGDQALVRIKTQLLLSVSPLKGDLYIRLSKDKYIKLFRDGDVFDLHDMEKYTVKKGVEYLFIRKEQCQEFAQKYLVELKKTMTGENLSIQEVGKLNVSVNETVRELVKKVGFSKEVQEITKSQVLLTMKSMGKDPNLAEILKKIEINEGQYISSHSTLCSYLACSIASQFKWGSESTFHKLTLASFLHDITIEREDLAEIQSLEELEEAGSKFTAKEQQDYKNHPSSAGELAKKMSEVPPDVDTIILQHHEKPNGGGFPRKLTHTYIAPLSCVFIIAHDLSRFSIQEAESFDLDKFLAGAKNIYTSGQFKKILGCLDSISKIKGLSLQINKKKAAAPAP